MAHTPSPSPAAARLKLAGAVLLLTLVAACNTMSGLGQDVEAAGDTISDTADDAQN